MPSPTNGSLPGSTDEEKKDMATTEIPVQYAERLKNAEAALQEVQIRYANEAAARVVQTLVNEGYRIKDQGKLRQRLAKLDDKGRAELAAEIRENYAQDERPPVSQGDAWIAADETPAITRRQPSPQQVDEVVRYAEENDLNVEKDADWNKACAAVMGK